MLSRQTAIEARQPEAHAPWHLALPSRAAPATLKSARVPTEPLMQACRHNGHRQLIRRRQATGKRITSQVPVWLSDDNQNVNDVWTRRTWSITATDVGPRKQPAVGAVYKTHLCCRAAARLVPIIGRILSEDLACPGIDCLPSAGAASASCTDRPGALEVGVHPHLIPCRQK